MRNYLFDRPVTAAPPPAPEKPKKKRRILPWALLCLILAAGAFAAVLLLWPEEESQGPSAFHGDGPSRPYSSGSPSPEDPGEEGGEPTIPRAPTGDGTTLQIESGESEVLTANGVYEKALPSVVSINAYTERMVASGSGIIMSADGYVLTNYHIVEGTSEAWVYLLTDGTGYEAELVGWAEDLDLAVLKIDAEGLTPAEFGSSRDLAVGDPVYALGNPLGYLYGSFSEGILSAPVRTISLSGYDMALIQTTAALNEGNSGGALLNQCGQVVGITTAKMSSSGSEVTVEGLGLALPISDLRGAVNSIIARGEVVTPRIGIMCYEEEIDGVAGILVDSVEVGPARDAGIRPGDFITAANGIPTATVGELKDIFYDIGVGGTVTLTILRDGEELFIPMRLSD